MDKQVMKYSQHDCVEHNKKFPNNLMDCYGQLCCDCPFTDKFRKRGLIKKV